MFWGSRQLSATILYGEMLHCEALGVVEGKYHSGATGGLRWSPSSSCGRQTRITFG